MAKSSSPFAGMKLTEQTPLADTPIDQRLFSNSPLQSGAAKSTGEVETKESSNRATKQTSKPVKQSPAAIDKVEKYTTHLEPSLIKKIKLAAIEKDMKDYDVVRAALLQYFENHR